MSATDEITSTEDLINYSDVTARIAYLENITASLARDLEEWEAGELAALRDLAADMEPVNEYAGRATAIHDEYMTEFVQNEADDIAGIGTDSYLFSYVNWDELASDRTMGMTVTTYLGTTYYIAS